MQGSKPMLCRCPKSLPFSLPFFLDSTNTIVNYYDGWKFITGWSIYPLCHLLSKEVFIHGTICLYKATSISLLFDL